MKYSKKTMKAILEFIVVCLAIVFVFKGIIMPVKVDGSSMYPTLHDGDLAFMSRLDLNSKQIKRFDIVTIDCKQLGNVIIKRVIDKKPNLNNLFRVILFLLCPLYFMSLILLTQKSLRDTFMSFSDPLLILIL